MATALSSRLTDSLPMPSTVPLKTPPSSLSEVLSVIPSPLHFSLRLNSQATCHLTLQSRVPYPLAFKIKTTRPKRYCVQPNVATLSPNDVVLVEVTMRELENEWPSDLDRCKDKFQVLAVVQTGDLEGMDAEEVWEKVDRDHVRQQKMKVVLSKAEDKGGVMERSDVVEKGGNVDKGEIVEKETVELEDMVVVKREEERKTAGKYYPLNKPKPATAPPGTSLVTGLGDVDVGRVSGAKPPLPPKFTRSRSPSVARGSPYSRNAGSEARSASGGSTEALVEINEERKLAQERLEKERAEREQEEERIRQEKEKTETERRRREEELERVIHPAVAPVPAVPQLSVEERKRIAAQRAQILVKILKERNDEIEELKKRLAEETSKLADARMAVAGAQHVKYEIDYNAKIPLAQVGLMTAIAVTTIGMFF